MKVASTVLNGSVRGRPLARPLTTQPRQFAQVGEPASRAFPCAFGQRGVST